MKVFLSLLVSVAIASPAFAGITANGSYDDERAIEQSQEVDFVIFEEGFDVPSTNAYKNFTIHWTSSFSQDWCMWLVLERPSLDVIDGGINGTICDGSADDNWMIDSVTPLGGGTFDVRASHVTQTVLFTLAGERDRST